MMMHEGIVQNLERFNHFVSLGYSCYIAQNLQDMGLRNESLPFDWLASSLSGVLKAIETQFSDFLSYDLMYQDSKYHHAYKNIAYDFSFYHDCKKELPLRWQISSVRRKYARRIARFYKVIQEPTLFIRYVRNWEELEWLEENHKTVEELLKGYCAFNGILYIFDIEESVVFDEKIPNLYHVKKDEGEKLTKKPIISNQILYSAFEKLEYPNKEKNLSFYANKKPKTTYRGKVEKKLRRVMKDYKHNKQMRI